MASRSRHMTSFSANHKTALTSKPTNPRLRQMDQNRKFSTVPEMSPEARRAVLLAREDTKENNINSKKKENTSHTLGTQNDVDTNNNTACMQGKGERNIRTSQSSRTPQKTQNRNTKISSSRPPRGPNTGTSRSRSTLSQNEPPFSMSDNNEISSHMGTNTTSNASVYTSNLSSGNNNNGISYSNFNINMNGITDTNPNDDDPDDDVDSALPNDDSFDEDEEEEDSAFKTNSFVLALDKALEKKEISRLKGDITDAAQISKPGTVRALNGGRLTNAQEVVVNVCHDDDTELVFHDDDEESIDTAKTISKIRVNIWMEYNSRFPPDTNLNDFDPPHFTDDNYKKEPEVKQRPPPPVSAMKTREKSFFSNQRQGTSRDTTVRKASGDSGSISSGANYLNSTSSFKRTPSNSRLRSVTPSPTPSQHGSGNSSRGKVNSPSTKPATPLRTRR